MQHELEDRMMPRARRKGFTLVEVLVVLLITSIVMAVLVSVLGSSFEILRLGQTRAQLISNARSAIEYISKDFQTATAIPMSSDRDLNGYPDEWTSASLNPNAGYGTDALWRVSENQGGDIVTWARVLLSEAWSDRVMISHSDKSYSGSAGLLNESFNVPRVLTSNGAEDVVDYTSFFRVALPANNLMPYYLLPPSRCNGGVIPGYPDQIALGPHKETAVLMQDIFYHQRGSQEPLRVRQIPVASNITRVTIEYMHEVPVYMSRVNSGDIEIAFQDLSDGSISWQTESSTLHDQLVPMVDHWEQRVVDVSNEDPVVDGAPDNVIDGAECTGASYGGNTWNLAHQYPEEDEAVDSNRANNFNTWNCAAFFNIPSDDPINAPVDRRAYVTTTADAAGNPIEGGTARLRPDMATLQGTAYQLAVDAVDSNAGSGTFGDADGIPDGDGLPDNPVPSWWLPYVRAVKITVIATPQRTMEQRTAASGKANNFSPSGFVYYRLDSPIPYADPQRSQPLLNQKQDYVGAGQDLILTKTVPVNFSYRMNPVTDPRDPSIGQLSARRVEINYRQGITALMSDPVASGSGISARSPYEKLIELDPSI